MNIKEGTFSYEDYTASIHKSGGTFSYEDYTASIHKSGRIGLSIALVMLLAAPFVFSLVTGASIQWDGFAKASIAVCIIYIPSCIVEYLIYVPLLGPGASYLAWRRPEQRSARRRTRSSPPCL